MRRSLFSSEAERAKFLNRLVTGTRDVLASERGLSEHANYHEFCRLLGRLKTNYQLSELVRACVCFECACGRRRRGGASAAMNRSAGRCVRKGGVLLAWRGCCRCSSASSGGRAGCLLTAGSGQSACTHTTQTNNTSNTKQHTKQHTKHNTLNTTTQHNKTTPKVAVDNYTEWIQLVASLTISSLQSWQWANQSM